MGTDLDLKYKGDDIAWLGRSYHYEDENHEVETSVDEIDETIEEHITDSIIDIMVLAMHSPRYEEMEDIKDDVRRIVNDIVFDSIRLGKRHMLSSMLTENENLSIEKRI